MGAVLNSLTNLPIDKNVHLYIFVINGEYKELLYEMLEKNFLDISRSIGNHALIAVGTDKRGFSTSVAKRYLGKGNSDQSFLSLLPALLITDSHPDKIHEQSMRLVVPLKDAEQRFGSWQQFFDSLTSFARGENIAFVQRFETKENLLDAANKVINLKPGMFGFSLNINELIDRWIKSRAQRPAT